MRIAIFGDIHGNLVALETVLADLARTPVDQMVCLGDVASTGPQPREVVQRLRELGCPVVMGNADTELISPIPDVVADDDTRRFVDMDRWAVAQLSAADLDFLRTFQPTVEVALGDGVSLLCCHGTPRSNTELLTATTLEEELDEILAGCMASLLAGGHTHRPMLRHHAGVELINPGSVGLPYGTPMRAEYALIEVDSGRLEIGFRRLPLDLDAVRRAALTSGMPHAAWWAEGWQ